MSKKEDVPKNVKKLVDYINDQENPNEFMNTLFLISKPRFNDFTNSHKESKISVS